jgi:site-specific DNA recombinase
MNKQAAIYARVSTDDQAERGYSLPSQIEACQQFAWQRGFDVVAVYQDDISGAKPITHRPEGGELQNAINTRQINTVIVYQVDRLSRDIVDLLATVRDWLRSGVEVYALDVGQVTSELDIVLVIKGWQGSDERQKIAERTKRGKDGKAKAGRVVGVGTPPYGYTYSNGELVINELQAETVSMIFDWYVNGDEQGHSMSLLAIAKRLTEMGIPRPGESKSVSWKLGMKERAHSKAWAGNVWNTGTVHKLVINETYCGAYRYGKLIGYRGNGGQRQLDEQILINVPAIISREMWELAQKRRAYNSKVAKRRTKYDYLLRGLLYCGCGRVMVGGGKGKWYVCTRRYRPTGHEEPCTEPLVKARAVEYITWEYMMRLLTNVDEFEQALREAQALEASQIQPKQKELENVIALLSATEYEAETVAETAKKVRGIVAEKLQAQAVEIDRRYRALQTRKASLEDELKSELTDSSIDDLLQFREAVAIGLNNPMPEERRQWLEALQTRVTVSNGIAVVACRLSRDAVEFDLFTEYNASQNWGVN